MLRYCTRDRCACKTMGPPLGASGAPKRVLPGSATLSWTLTPFHTTVTRALRTFFPPDQRAA
jgi:hypothetical protein